MSVTKDPEANWAATFVASLDLAKQAAKQLSYRGYGVADALAGRPFAAVSAVSGAADSRQP